MSGRSETILVVEDDLSILEGLELNLRLLGYRVATATRADDGLELARSARPDLIVLDLMLPDGSGLDLLSTLRAEDREMQVVILSALGLDSDKVRGLRSGADDYVTKPFSLDELLARIDAALRRQRAPRAAAARDTVCFGEVTIRRSRREVSLGARAVPLTRREYDVLLLLAEHPERVYSREQILSAVWGEGYTGTPRTVDNFIRALRRKLEPDTAEPRHLVTVHGVGYTLRP